MPDESRPCCQDPSSLLPLPLIARRQEGFEPTACCVRKRLNELGERRVDDVHARRLLAEEMASFAKGVRAAQQASLL